MAFGSFDNKGAGSTVSEINMVPLIDVMLVLLVIFIITAPLLSHSIKIDLPQVSAEPVQQEPKVIDVAIDGSGIVYWNEQPTDLQQLGGQFAAIAAEDPQPTVRIRADHDTRYEILAQIMSSARAAGIKRLGFVTRPDASGPAASAVSQASGL